MPKPTTEIAPEPTFPNLIIRASAGTGKTFALSNRYLGLLVRGVEVQEILASTFTKKGAGEILDRIVSRLSSAALSAADAEKLSTEIGCSLTQTQAGKILLKLLQSLHRLEVGTLDSLFSRIARVFSLELGLPPGWEIVETQQTKRLHDRAITKVLESNSAIELLQLLSKGEVARRVASLVQETVDQVYSIFRQSGLEPWDKIPATTHYLSEQEIEAIVLELQALPLTLKSLMKQRDALVQLIAEKNWLRLTEMTSIQNVLDGKEKFGNTKMPPELIQLIHRLTQQCRAYHEDVLIRQNRATRDLLDEFHKIVYQLKSISGDLRFDDVTERLQEFIQQCDAQQCAYRLDSQFRHLLLDEFQDTSLTQWNVIKPFAQRVTEQVTDQQSFFCVGDMKQAIYGWRGGVAEIFDRVADELPHLKPDDLDKSYRSSGQVIDFVNQIFGNSLNYRCGDPIAEQAIAQWHNWFPVHKTARDDLAGYVTIEKSPADEFIDPDGIELSGNDRLEFNTIQRIKGLVSQLSGNQSIGVIVRRNSEVSRIMSLLKQQQIPASDESGSSLVDSAAVELILSAMKLADQPGDSVARFHLSHSPLADPLGLIPETQNNQFDAAKAGTIAAEYLRRRLLQEGYGGVIESLAQHLIPCCTSRELNRLQQLIQVAYSSAYHKDPWDLRPGRFVEYVINDVRVSEPTAAQVRVMTIHKAKGLEFDAVVLPIPQSSGSWSGHLPAVVVGRPSPTAPIEIVTRYVGRESRKLFPDWLQQIFVQENQRDVREALCVLYVAVTRAVHAVHVIVPDNIKADHKSTAGLIVSSVCPSAETDPETGLIYQAGDEQWFQKRARNIPSTPKDRSRELSLFYDSDFNSGNQDKLPVGVKSGRGLFGEDTLPSSSPTATLQEWLADWSPSPSAKAATTATAAATTSAATATDPVESIPSVPPFPTLQPEILNYLQSLTWLDHQQDRPSTLHGNSVEINFGVVEAWLAHPNISGLLSYDTYLRQFLGCTWEDAQATEIQLKLGGENVGPESPTALSISSGGGGRGELDFHRVVTIFQRGKLIGADLILFDNQVTVGGAYSSFIAELRTQYQLTRQLAASRYGLPLEQIAVRIVFLNTGELVNLYLMEISVPEGMSATANRETTRKPSTPKRAPANPKKNLNKTQSQANPDDHQPPTQRTLW